MKIPTLGIEMDIFGDTDPKKMPRHLFSDLRSMDYSTATRADVARQNYSVCPRHWYIDAIFKCVSCGEDFLFSVSEQRFWYESRRFYVDSRPIRCVACRKKERIRRREAQIPEARCSSQEDAVVSATGPSWDRTRARVTTFRRNSFLSPVLSAIRTLL
jgi:hypothetical protein